MEWSSTSARNWKRKRHACSAPRLPITSHSPCFGRKAFLKGNRQRRGPRVFQKELRVVLDASWIDTHFENAFWHFVNMVVCRPWSFPKLSIASNRPPTNFKKLTHSPPSLPSYWIIRGRIIATWIILGYNVFYSIDTEKTARCVMMSLRGMGLGFGGGSIHSINQSIKQPVNQSVNQSNNQCINQSFNHQPNQSTNQSINPSQSNKQAIYQSISIQYQLHHSWISLFNWYQPISININQYQFPSIKVDSIQFNRIITQALNQSINQTINQYQ